jgi:hypothetical protein
VRTGPATGHSTRLVPQARRCLINVPPRVIVEGPFGQAHRVYGPNNTHMIRQPRKGGDQAYLAVCGATIASAVIKSLFGFNLSPGAEHGLDHLLERPDVPRGFDGTLRNVRYRGKLVDIVSEAGRGLRAQPAAALASTTNTTR